MLQTNVAASCAAIPLPDPFLFRIRDVVYQVAGIFQSDERITFLEDRCLRRMKALSLRSLAEYFDCLTMRADRDAEIRNLLNEITVGETCFFRYPAQLEALRKVILPAIIEAKGKLSFTRLRVWSAGCSTGEEPYTLSIFFQELQQSLLRGWTVEVLATDLNERSLERARRGVYTDYALRNVTPDVHQKYFVPVENGQFQVSEAIRSRVQFNRLNLLDDSRVIFMKGLDLVFCCNVMIYFDGSAKRKVVQHFHSNLLPNGYLFLGHSESLFGYSNDFRLVHFPETTAYLKPSGLR